MKNTTLPHAIARRAALAGFSMIALSGLALQAEALDSSGALPAPQAGPTAAKNPPTALSTGLAEQFNTGVANGGTMSITRFQAGVMAPFRLTDALVVSTSFKYGLDSYDFRSVPPQWRGPWHNINTYTLATIVQGTIDDQWSVYGGGLVRESGETGAEFLADRPHPPLQLGRILRAHRVVDLSGSELGLARARTEAPVADRRFLTMHQIHQLLVDAGKHSVLILVDDRLLQLREKLLMPHGRTPWSRR